MNERHWGTTAALLSVLLLTVTACANELSGSGGQGCSGGTAAPVTAPALIAALREHGFSAKDDPSMCMVDGDIAGVSNLADDRNGSVLCRLGSAQDSGSPTVSATRYVTDSETGVRALNAGCSLYPSMNEATELHRLYAAFHAVVRNAVERGVVTDDDFGRLPAGVERRRCRPPDPRDGSCSLRDEPLTQASVRDVCLRRTNVYRDGLLVRETEYEWYC